MQAKEEGNLEKRGRAKVVCGREVGCREQRRGREGRRSGFSQLMCLCF